ncbi:7-cyano-7-deazaguanine synthase [Cellulomonas composti]|uniref:7-cyano-7-deazaguanine synthase n=1 Tax=Cellulomonas composti TaxID=266130 RepID=A0A511J9H6_9CELL|nr:7-cyano-7-deazaguanine synthase [Cellulomonas composti]GEL94647.1 hypothetical protein CCO02nite_13050 [Cellulomonas composti]
MAEFRRARFDPAAVRISSENAVVMLSGGLDSTVALWWALEHYGSVRAVSLDYGQPHRAELRAAARLAAVAGVERAVVRLDLPRGYRDASGMFIRGHTSLMGGLGALGVGAAGADVVLGMLATDPYADCGAEYLDALSAGLVNEHDEGPTRVVAPLLALEDKTAVAALGFELGAPWHVSWSCRRPLRGRPCADCSACRSRAVVDRRLDEEYGLPPAVVRSWQAVMGSPSHPVIGRCSDELRGLGQRIASAGGAERGTVGTRYVGPDGARRLAPHVRGARRAELRRPARTRYVRARGHGWQVAVCDDGAVAATDGLPSLDTIQRSLVAAVAAAPR